MRIVRSTAAKGKDRGRARYCRCVPGGIVIALVMLLVLPVAVMLAGAVWSGLMGWLLSEDAAHRNGET